MPAEHGGWGLTLEPGLLGVLVAPSLAGILLAIAALLAFLVRTPLRLLLIGRRPGRAGQPPTNVARQRDALAGRVVLLELAGVIVCVIGALALSTGTAWWLPGVLAAPLFGVALWYDRRSQSRRLIPEIAGSLAIASVASMGARAGGAEWALALGLWLVLAARILTSIPHVRAQVLRIHGHRPPRLLSLGGDVAALLVAALAVLVDASLVAGALAVLGLVIFQRLTLSRPPRPARILGLRQMLLGLSVVGFTAMGTWLA
jgi:membrane protein implicated in regulation of membrane protease activity